jgi:hypothetical protein
MFLKWAGALPVLGAIVAEELRRTATAAVTKSGSNIYARIGVRPFINARGTWTYLSGSLELPEVRAAKEEASRHFVDIFELQRAAGKRLAEFRERNPAWSRPEPPAPSRPRPPAAWQGPTRPRSGNCPIRPE